MALDNHNTNAEEDELARFQESDWAAMTLLLDETEDKKPIGFWIFGLALMAAVVLTYALAPQIAGALPNYVQTKSKTTKSIKQQVSSVNNTVNKVFLVENAKNIDENTVFKTKNTKNQIYTNDKNTENTKIHENKGVLSQNKIKNLVNTDFSIKNKESKADFIENEQQTIVYNTEKTSENSNFDTPQIPVPNAVLNQKESILPLAQTPILPFEIQDTTKPRICLTEQSRQNVYRNQLKPQLGVYIGAKAEVFAPNQSVLMPELGLALRYPLYKTLFMESQVTYQALFLENKIPKSDITLFTTLNQNAINAVADTLRDSVRFTVYKNTVQHFLNLPLVVGYKISAHSFSLGLNNAFYVAQSKYGATTKAVKAIDFNRQTSILQPDFATYTAALQFGYGVQITPKLLLQTHIQRDIFTNTTAEKRWTARLGIVYQFKNY